MSDEQTPVETPALIPETSSAPDVATVPSYRLREETDRRAKAEGDAKSARSALATLSTQFEELQRTNEALSTKHNQDIALFVAGITDGEVREFVRSRFSKRENTETSFSDWLNSERETPSAILKPFLSKSAPEPSAPETPAATAAVQKEAPNPNVGTGQPNNHQSKAWGAEELAVIRKQNHGRLGPNKEAILSALRAEGLVK